MGVSECERISAAAIRRESSYNAGNELIASKLEIGLELVQMDVPEHENPWLKMAGMWDKDDPLVQEWKEIIAENRRKEDEAPNFSQENSNESSGV
ncbi:MAG TPA: hypothetical protein VMF69_18835 [Gemmataceae bacterium]|nr:hypothetical protein [Gemmataceae bacterium]